MEVSIGLIRKDVFVLSRAWDIECVNMNMNFVIDLAHHGVSVAQW